MRVSAALISAAVLFSGLTGAAPARKRDSSSGDEVAVSAPNGVVESDTAELSSQLASASAGAGQSTSFASDSGVQTVDPSAIPTGDPLSGGAVGSGGDAIATSTAIAPPLATSLPPSGSYGSSSYGSSGISMPSYGSGSSSWMSSYNSCVQTCMVTYPPPPTQITMPTISSGSDSSVISSGSDSSSSSNSSDSSGSGQVWNIVVAPHQGVLRYVPSSVEAAVGDTIRFTWGAGPHTVTQSSPVTPCNGSIGGFASGMQNVGFTFDQVVNDTNPIFFYCGVPSHCQKGMFGSVNPPQAPGANTSVAAMMPMWAAGNPDVAAALNATNVLAVGTPAETWGQHIDMSGIDPSLHLAMAKDLLYTRAFMASNPKMYDANGKFNPTGNSAVLPADVSALFDTADLGNNNVTPAVTSTSASPAASSSAPVADAAAPKSAALSVRSSSVAVAIAAVVAVVFAL